MLDHLVSPAKMASALPVMLLLLTLAASGKKDEPMPAPSPRTSDTTATELDCSYTPRQSALAAELAGAAGGSAAATAALAQMLGMSVVPHTFVAEQRVALLKSGDDAIAYANRKSVEISGALQR